MNKKLICTISSFLLVLISYSFSQGVLPRKEYEPAGLNPVYALDLPSNFNDTGFRPEVYEYYDICNKFKTTLKMLSNDKGYDFLLGKWKLNEPTSEVIPNLEGFDLCNNFIIRIQTGYFYFVDGIPCPIYTNNYGDLYYFTDWRGILKKIIYFQEKIQIYHLVNDLWVLDIVQGKDKHSYYKKQ